MDMFGFNNGNIYYVKLYPNCHYNVDFIILT